MGPPTTAYCADSNETRTKFKVEGTSISVNVKFCTFLGANTYFKHKEVLYSDSVAPIIPYYPASVSLGAGPV